MPSDEPRECGNIDAVLADYTQTRIDVRHYNERQFRIIISGLATIGAILGYTMLFATGGSYSNLMLLGLFSIMLFLMILAIEEERNRRHAQARSYKIEKKLQILNGIYKQCRDESAHDRTQYPAEPYHLWLIAGVLVFLYLPLIIITSPIQPTIPIPSWVYWTIIAIGVLGITIGLYYAYRIFPPLPTPCDD